MEPDRKPVLNSEQRNAAYCTENTVVAAGAGSGKTMVLASRYSWLITEKKIRVPEILTLTFTKKAAAQMYRRIHLELAEKAREDAGEKGRLAKQALEEFALARIQTLDSYCASIVKQAANRYGISPDFSIDEDRCRQLALDESLPFLIACREHPAMERLYLQKNPVYIAKNIFAKALFNHTCIHDLPPDPKEALKAQFAIISMEWKRQKKMVLEKLDELTDVYRGNDKYHPDLAPILRQYNEGLLVFPTEQELDVFFEQLTCASHKSAVDWAESHPLHKAMLSVLAFFVSMKELNLAKGSPRDNPAKDAIKEFRRLFGEFSALMVFCLQAGLIYSVIMLLSELQHRYVNRKRAEGILTFSDVASLAKTIMLEQRDIRQGEKETFKAIMIDEFQDNNELQKDMLFFLAEKLDVFSNSVPLAKNLSPGKLFFVGDEKQSIYRFRGADVSVFRKLKSELGNMELPLATNYRSTPLLIGAFNTIFGGYDYDPNGKTPADAGSSAAAKHHAVFAQNSPSLPAFEATYTPLEAAKETGGKLVICILDKQDDVSLEEKLERLSPVENEARYVAEKIKALLAETDDTGKQKYSPNDIAILFRSRNPQHYFEKHLMLLNVPYASENLNGFFYGGPVNDIMSVLRLVAYPMDRAAYAQMLRSPFAGLSIPGLTACLAVTESGDVEQGFQRPFGDEPIPGLTDEDMVKYDNGQRIYQKIADLACRQNISSLISELWFAEGYRYETEWNPQTAAFREMYDYLFHLAVQADEGNVAGPMGLAAFTDYIQSLGKAGERLSDIEIPLERQGAVHLMTIHKSKGLEFPVVFLCCCDKRGRNDISDDIFETEFGLMLNPPLPMECEDIKDIKRNYFWDRSIAIENKKRTAELRRLLYVGMTRAEKELYLSGCLGVSKCCGVEQQGADENASENKNNFSMLLKQYIEAQADKTTEKAVKNGTKDDGLLDGDTFFGLCLPAFGSHIQEDGPSFFAIEEIPTYTEQYIHDAEDRGSRFQNDQKGLNGFFEVVDSCYGNAEILKTPRVNKKHFSPTAMSANTVTGLAGESGAVGEALQKNFTVNIEYSGVDASDVFGNVEKLLEHYAKTHAEYSEKFNQGSFGTIAHICVEALLGKKKAVIPPKLAGFLTVNEADDFLDAGNELAQRFIRSPLGVIASEAKDRKSEFPFRSLVCTDENDFFINGVIDLVFEDAETVYVVDFKTDSQETPKGHIPQMACYYRAASELFAVPAHKSCRIWLYYLRSGHAVEVTGPAMEHSF